MIDILILDIEGTITTSGGSPGGRQSELQDRLHELEQKGCSVILCSGRDLAYIRDLKHAWGLKEYSPIIAENGCVIFDGTNEYITFNVSDFDPDKIISKLSRTSLLTFAEFDPAKKYMATVYPKGFSTGVAFTSDQVRTIFEFVKPILSDMDIAITYSSCSVDILPKDMDKMHGLKALHDRLASLDLSRSMYIGDSRNDLAIGKYINTLGGLFCVPSNALDELKSNANYIASKHYDEGVLEILDRYQIN